MAKYLDYDGLEYALRKLIADLDIPDVSSFITQTELNNTLSKYATQSWVNEQISEITGGSITSATVQEMIDNSLSEYVKKTEFATINGQSIINGGDITITGGGGDVDLSGYVKKTELKTINGDLIYDTNGGNIEVGGGVTIESLTTSDIDKAFEEAYNN